MNNSRQLDKDLGQIRSLALGELPDIASGCYRRLAVQLSDIAAIAMDSSVSDEEFTKLLEPFAKDPTQFRDLIDPGSMAEWLERSMGTAAASGVVRRREQISTPHE